MKNIIEELSMLPATSISDATDGLNHFDPAIKPLNYKYKICGRAVTVKMPAGDNMMVVKAIKEGKPGDILVIDAEGYRYRAVAGAFIIGLAQTMGFGGVVAYGAVRDMNELGELDFPVFCMGGTLACSKKNGSGQINVPITCGSATVSPGDIIIGDADGVIAIPQDQAGLVLAAAKKKVQKDEERARRILGSRTAAIEFIDTLLPEIRQA